MPYLGDAFQEIREVEAFTSRSAQAREVAASLTQADVARINQIAEMYPHMSPDSLMVVGRSGLAPDSPQVFQVAQIEARKVQREHPLGRRYGAPAVTPGQRRLLTDRSEQAQMPSWHPQSGNPDAVAAWDEANRFGLVREGILTTPQGPDHERYGDAFDDILQRLTAAGEEVPLMTLDGDWKAQIVRRSPGLSQGEEMHSTPGEIEQRRPGSLTYQDITPTQAQPTQPSGGGGRFGGIGGGIVGAVPGAGDIQQAERALATPGQVTGTQMAAIGGIKDAMRGIFALQDAPIQELQGQIRNAYGATHGQNVDWWETQSDLGISATTSIDDMGQGFFVDQESEVAQERRRREAERGQIGGHNVTFGRWLADATPFATDSKPSLILSGFGDLGVQLADPTAFVYGQAGRIGEGRTLFRAAGLLDDEAGVIRGLRNVIDSPTAAHFLDSTEGAARLIHTANEGSPYRIWRSFNRKIDFDLANELADANTPEAVRAILEPQLGTSIREVSTVSMPGMTDAITGGVNYRDPYRAAGSPLQMPLRGPIDAHDKDVVGQEVEAWMHNIHASDDEIAARVDQVARSQDPIHLNAAIRDTLRDGNGILAREGVSDPQLRNRLVAISQTAHEEASNTFKATMSAQTPTYNDLQANDIPVHDVGANLYVEHAPRHLTLPDARTLRRAVSNSPFRHIFNNPDTAQLRLGFSILDQMQNEIWKPLQLVTRIAWPVRVIAEEQIRMAAAGYDSFFKNPMSAIAWSAGRRGRGKADSWLHPVALAGDVVGRKGQEGVMGNAIEEMNEFKASLSAANGGWVDRRIASRGATTYNKATDLIYQREAYTDAVASEILRLHSDPVAVRLANEASLDDTKAWFSEGSGLKYKGGLAAAHPDKFATRAQADAYLEIVGQRVQRASGGNVEIADVIRTGRWNGEDIFDGNRINADFKAWLDGQMDEFGPDQIIGEAPTGTTAAGDRLRAGTDRMFSILMTKPTNYLSRSRTFKQAYWQEAGRLMQFADADTRRAVQAAAEAAGVTIPKRALKRTARSVEGTLDLESLDLIARGHGLDQTRELLYDLTRKGRKMDAARVVFPFGEAWAEVLTRWFGTGLAGGDSVGLVWKNPKTIRRFQQIVQGARGEDLGEVMGAPEGQGFFWKNGFGEEVFIYPGTQIFTEHALGVPVPLTGRVQGLSMFGTVMPGLGLVAQIPVGWFMSAKPGPQAFKEFLNDFESIPLGPFGTVKENILPFGAVGAEDQSAITDISNYVPPWIRNGLQTLTEGDMRPDAYASDVMDTMAYLRSTGDYGDSPEELQRLAEDAQNKARKLYFVRALTGFAAPASPDFEFMVENDQGNLLRLAALRDEYFDMREEDPRTAGQTFLDKYGPDIHAVVTTSQTTSSRLGTPMTAAGVHWVLEHPGIEDDLPYTYGLFAPEGGPDDFALYRDEMGKGQRLRLDPEAWNRLLNNTKGNMIWAQAHAQIEGSPNRNEAQWLRDIADQLREEYPGWGDTTGRLEGTDTQQLVSELETAVNHPAIRDTDAAEGLRIYLTARDRAVANAEAAGLQGFDTASSMEGTRAWLNDVAVAVIAEHPDFEPMWRWVFSREAETEE